MAKVNLHMRAFGVAAILISFSAIAGAQSTASIPADVETVLSGGSWKSGNSKGSYRIVIRSGGFGHVVSQLQVDWITESVGNDKPARVIASKVAETGSWRFANPRIVKDANGWCITVEGARVLAAQLVTAKLVTAKFVTAALVTAQLVTAKLVTSERQRASSPFSSR